MTTTTKQSTPDEIWAALAAPFPAEDIEKLPKPVSRQDQDRGRCERGSRVSADGHFCGGWHSRSVHLDYVGHAGITTRLNEVLGPAGWEFAPYNESPEGLPLIARGEFFAKLTIRVGDQTVTKWDLAANFNSTQEAVGDALRRCAMRFGVGTYLWSKSESAHNKAAGADAVIETTDQVPAKPSANELYEAIRNHWNNAQALRRIHAAILENSYEDVQVTGPSGTIPLADLALDRAKALEDEQPHPTDAEKLRQAAESRQVPRDGATGGDPGPEADAAAQEQLAQERAAS